MTGETSELYGILRYTTEDDGGKQSALPRRLEENTPDNCIQAIKMSRQPGRTVAKAEQKALDICAGYLGTVETTL